jgi:ATP-dependent Clp protease ATP-binding subunit ClpA
MPVREEPLRREVHSQAYKSINQFRAIMERLGQNPEIKAAYDSAPTAITRGRSFGELAMDDAQEAFVHIMADVPAQDVPVDYYRQMMPGGGKDVAIEDAAKAFEKHRAAVKAERVTRTKAIPDFIGCVMDKVPGQIAMTLIQNWNTTLNNMQMLALSESALQAQAGANELAEQFNGAMQNRAAQRIQEKAMMAKIDGLGAPEAGARVPVRTEPAAPSLPPRLKSLLDAFGDDLTAAAKGDKEIPVIGREADVERTLSALVRSQKPYALLSGAEGIGKSAVARGVARRIADGDVPAEFKDAKVIRLKLREMKAASGMAQGKDPKLGEARMYEQFTDWFNTILRETAEYNAKGGQQIILDIDELGEMGGRIPTIFQAKDVLAAGMAENKGLRLIGEISDVKRKAVEEVAGGMLEQFSEIKLKPLSVNLTVEALKKNGFAAQDDAMLRKTVEWTNQFVNDGEQPGKAIDILVSAQAHAKVRGAELGEQQVIEVLSELTGRPKHMFGKSKSEQLKELEKNLPNRVMGQPEIEKILKVIKAGNSSLAEPTKPIARVMLVGPTGNGKTETAKVIAEELGIPLVTIDMSNFQDQHAKAKLIGSPPGYVGFDKKAALEDVADNPYCVLLLDEIDKAHPEVHNIFLSVFDEGRVQLMNGKTVYFNNTIIIATSNFGARAAQEAKNKSSAGFNSSKGGDDAAKEEYKKAIDSKMPPEYQNRLDLIAYFGSLSQEVMKKITASKIGKVSKTLREAENLDLKLSEQAMAELAELGYDEAFGARPLDRAIKNYLNVPLLDWMEEHHQDRSQLVSVFVQSVKDKFDIKIVPPEAPKAKALPGPAPA